MYMQLRCPQASPPIPAHATAGRGKLIGLINCASAQRFATSGRGGSWRGIRSSSSSSSSNSSSSSSSSGTSSSSNGDGGGGENLGALIADVLNSNKAQFTRPADLLALIDSAGHGVETVVRRSWDTTAVGLSLQGTWAKSAEARKMAMLAVYQERLVTRAALLLQLLRWVAEQHPQLLESSLLPQVEAAAVANPLNAAVEQLQVPQLTMLAAALLPWPVLRGLVEAAVAAVKQSLLSKPPYSYSPSRRQAAVLQLQWVEGGLCRGAAMARLRALLLEQGRLSHWEQAAAAAAAAAAAETDGGSSSSSSSALLDTGGRLITPEQMYHEAWKIQRQQQQQQEQSDDPWAAAGAGAGSSRTIFQPPYQTLTSLGGRVFLATFHARTGGGSCSSTGSMLQVSSGVAAAVSSSAAAGAAAAAAAGGGKGGEARFVSEGAAGAEVLEVCRVLQQLTSTIRVLKEGMPGSTNTALGVLPEVQRFHRAALLDLLISWAAASPAISQTPLPAVAAAKVAISSIEHDRLLRRIGLEASGAEVSVLRQLAVSKGSSFLNHFSPTVGNPFAATAEWDYFRECPGVFVRFVEDPHTTSATLTLKDVHHASKQQQQQQQSSASQDVVLLLSQQQLQQLMQQLILLLSDSRNSNSSSSKLAAVPGSGASIVLRAYSSTINNSRGSAKSSLSPAAAAAVTGEKEPQLELLMNGAVVAQLLPEHVRSLMTVLEDVTGQLYRQYSVVQPQVQISPASPAKRAADTTMSFLAQAARATAAAALLALPLLAIARPFRGLQLLPAASAAQTVRAAAARGSSSSPAGSSDSSNAAGTAAGSAVQAAAVVRTAVDSLQQPVNNLLTDVDLQQLCAVVAQQLEGQVWLPQSLCLATTSAAAGDGSRTAASSWFDLASWFGTGNAAAGTSTADSRLMFQIVVSRQGKVLGVKPCSSAAAAVLLELPAAAALRGPRLAAVQAKRLATITSADSTSTHPAKQPPRPSRSKVAYDRVMDLPLPQDGAVVLKLMLQPYDSSSSSSGNESTNGSSSKSTYGSSNFTVGNDIREASGQHQELLQEQLLQETAAAQGQVQEQQETPPPPQQQQQQQEQQQQQAVRVVGMGKSAVPYALMRPVVTPWVDQDSLTAWINSGAAIEEQHQQQADGFDIQQARQQHDPPGSGVTVKVDGQQVEALEALIKQLLAENAAGKGSG